MNSDTRTELITIEEKLAAAWVAGDQPFIESTLSHDWSVIDPTGRILTKAGVLKEAFTGEREIDEGKVDEVNVRDFVRLGGRHRTNADVGTLSRRRDDRHATVHGCVRPNLRRMEMRRFAGNVHSRVACPTIPVATK